VIIKKTKATTLVPI